MCETERFQICIIICKLTITVQQKMRQREREREIIMKVILPDRDF